MWQTKSLYSVYPASNLISCFVSKIHKSFDFRARSRNTDMSTGLLKVKELSMTLILEGIGYSHTHTHTQTRACLHMHAFTCIHVYTHMHTNTQCNRAMTDKNICLLLSSSVYRLIYLNRISSVFVQFYRPIHVKFKKKFSEFWIQTSEEGNLIYKLKFFPESFVLGR